MLKGIDDSDGRHLPVNSDVFGSPAVLKKNFRTTGLTGKRFFSILDAEISLKLRQDARVGKMRGFFEENEYSDKR